uniref:Transcription termination/antitermination protein NusG n=1 Tax=candidate division CPR3 bacterium TaxID=2268181 RepID=A0A7C5YQX1_UNCC3
MREKKEENNMKWYVLNTYAGQEKRVARLIMQRVENAGMKKAVQKAVVPTHKKVVIKHGKKETVEEIFYPGYILIHMVLNEKTWPLVRDTPGIIGFSGTGRRPIPLTDEEVEATMKYMKVKQPTYKVSLAPNDAVEIIDGYFKNFNGSVIEVDETKGRVKVLINILGRETPVEVDISQVKRLESH